MMCELLYNQETDKNPLEYSTSDNAFVSSSERLILYD
jgi:hypothetical protein